MGIREDNQTSYLKQEGKVSNFLKIKQEMTRQSMTQNVNHDRKNKTGNDETKHDTERKS